MILQSCRIVHFPTNPLNFILINLPFAKVALYIVLAIVNGAGVRGHAARILPFIRLLEFMDTFVEVGVECVYHSST